ncbi:MAG: orotate phosphoribosyltransferase [Candidatus Helarchaeota archaeon]
MDEKFLIEFLIKKGTLLFGEFTLKSGRVSPYFFNLGGAFSDGEGISTIARAYADYIRDKIGLNSFTFLLGPAYKGIPLVAQVAAILYEENAKNLRWGYNRKEAKTHGEASIQEGSKKVFDGELKDGDNILILDDVITKGTAKLEVMKMIEDIAAQKKIEVNIKGILVMIDRKEGAKNLREKMQIWSILDVERFFSVYKNVEFDGKVCISEQHHESFIKYKEKYMI